MMPNFLVIGASKSGTTSIHRYLEQHPEVYVSTLKEPKFFALEGERPDYKGPGDGEAWRDSVTSIGEYEALFDGTTDERAVGEVSPVYLYSEKAVGRIKHHVPDAKLIAVLRNPVERAYSSFLHKRRDGREPFDDFVQALDAEDERMREGWAYGWRYTRVGFYYGQLKRYFDAFAPGQIRVYLYEDLMDDPVGLMWDIYGFLGVDDTFIPDMSRRHNVSGIPKNRFVHSLLRGRNPVKTALKPLFPKEMRKRLLVDLQNRNLKKAPVMPSEARRRLTEAYREDILKLQGLIDRDLSGWLEA